MQRRGAVRPSVGPSVEHSGSKGFRRRKNVRGSLRCLQAGHFLSRNERGDLTGKKREEFRSADSGNRSSFSSPALGTDGWMVISNPLVEGRHSKAEVQPVSQAFAPAELFTDRPP